jgi:EAL domain-containing protein (putative c-di-GMP-specific phosphodiesterase class I)
VSGFDTGVLHSAQKLAVEQGLNFSGSLNKPFRPDVLLKLLQELTIVPKNSKSEEASEPPSIEEFRNALTYSELVVHYQPKIDFNDSSYLAVEALVRWQHPQRGLLTPGLFIPLAEKHGLIDDLTWYVLERALSDCNVWKEKNHNIIISINMSASTLKELYLPEKMEILMRKHKLDPSQIILEVTETSLMQELIKSLDILTRLRLKGFQLSIDDFGTGYSSLLQLHRVPFSEIKIDKSFVFELENDEEARSIVETIILLAQKLKMKTVAEGIETQENFNKLKALGCNQAQGFLLSKAMPADEIIDWFTNYNKN